MTSGPDEQALKRRFADFYALSQSPVMKAIERRVCGSDYGSSSWTTLAEADEIGALLGLAPGRRLLDLGAGTGWPAIHLAKRHGCDTVLLDLPFKGLRIAADRAAREELAGACWTVLADAAALPIAERSFDAVSHSDLLCCLERKREVLEACRRVIRAAGRMVFTVIAVAPALSPEAYRRAVAGGPDFIEAERDYPGLLDQAGWRVLEWRDVSADYAAACRRQLAAAGDNAADLRRLLGESTYDERVASWQNKLAVVTEGLIRRELYVVAPRVGQTEDWTPE